MSESMNIKCEQSVFKKVWVNEFLALVIRLSLNIKLKSASTPLAWQVVSN
jgi:hypothetical protein